MNDSTEAYKLEEMFIYLIQSMTLTQTIMTVLNESEEEAVLRNKRKQPQFKF